MIEALIIAVAIVAAAFLLRGRLVRRNELAQMSDSVWPIPVLNPARGDSFTPHSFTINDTDTETTVFFGPDSAARVDKECIETRARRDEKHARDKVHSVSRRKELRAALVRKHYGNEADWFNDALDRVAGSPIGTMQAYEQMIIDSAAARAMSREQLNEKLREVDSALADNLRRLDDNIEALTRTKSDICQPTKAQRAKTDGGTLVYQDGDYWLTFDDSSSVQLTKTGGKGITSPVALDVAVEDARRTRLDRITKDEASPGFRRFVQPVYYDPHTGNYEPIVPSPRAADDETEQLMRRRSAEAAGEINTVFPLDGDTAISTRRTRPWPSTPIRSSPPPSTRFASVAFASKKPRPKPSASRTRARGSKRSRT
jgi:hypothetical protein